MNLKNRPQDYIYLFVFVQNAYEKPEKGKLEMANFSFLQNDRQNCGPYVSLPLFGDIQQLRWSKSTSFWPQPL